MVSENLAIPANSLVSFIHSDGAAHNPPVFHSRALASPPLELSQSFPTIVPCPSALPLVSPTTERLRVMG